MLNGYTNQNSISNLKGSKIPFKGEVYPNYQISNKKKMQKENLKPITIKTSKL